MLTLYLLLGIACIASAIYVFRRLFTPTPSLSHEQRLVQGRQGEGLTLEEVLVIEDSPTDTELITRMLQPLCTRFQTADNGLAGLQQAKRGTATCIILDVILPQLDGYEVCRQLRASKLAMPIILITGSKTTTFDQQQAVRVGADCFLKKPFTAQDLQTAILTAITQRRQHLS